MPAGACNGIILNPLSAVRYECWGKQNPKLVATAARMWSSGGARSFVKGTAPTVLRDVVFGGVFSGTRHTIASSKRDQEGAPAQGFVVDMISAAAATVLSGPMNYCRNMIYAPPPEIKPATAWQHLGRLHQEAMAEPTLLARCALVQQRLRIGWGTMRVAVGMATGAQLFDRFSALLEE